MVKVAIPYTPRPAFEPYHHRKERFACLVCHRRAGKTVAVVNDLIFSAVMTQRERPRVAYIAPYYRQAKQVVWDYAKFFSAPIPGVRFNESELRIDYPNGGQLRLFGGDNYDALRGLYLDDVAIDESGDHDPRMYPEVIRPALADRKGRATFIGTPKGRNAFFDVWQEAQESPNWFAMMLKASETGYVDQDELDDARRMMTPEQYEQEWECSFDAAIVGAYYAAQIAEAEAEGRVCEVEPDLELPVHTAWDLGIGDSTAIWLWQAVPGGIRVIDHIEDHGKSLPYYAGVLNAKGHNYGLDFVPHDARARELGTGRTRVETLYGIGRNPQLLALNTIDDGINAVRQTLPLMWFDAKRCKDGLEALRQYRTEYDDKTKSFKNRPRHDWTSHTADAMRYLAMAYRDITVVQPKPKPVLKPGQVLLPGPPEPSSKTRIRL